MCRFSVTSPSSESPTSLTLSKQETLSLLTPQKSRKEPEECDSLADYIFFFWLSFILLLEIFLVFEEDEEDPFKEDLVQFCIETFVPFVPSCLCCTTNDL